MARDFASEFNRLVGNRTRRTWGRPSPVVNDVANPAARARSVARGDSIVPSRATRNFQIAAGIGNSGGGVKFNSQADVDSGWQSVYDRLMSDFQTNQAEQQAISAANTEQQGSQDRPWYGDVWNAIGGGLGVMDNGSGFAGSILGRGLDLLSRPAYGVFSGLENVVNEQGAPTGGQFTPGDIGSFIPGFIEGITGKNKAGFGDVYEAGKNSPMGESLRDLEEAHPQVESWLSRGVGLAGELGLDPLNVIMPAAPNVMRRTGELATEPVLRQSIMGGVDRAVEDIINNPAIIDGSREFAANPQVLTDRLLNAANETFNESVVNVHGGGSRGVRMPPNTPQYVADRVVGEARTAFTEPIRVRADMIWNSMKKEMNVNYIDKMRSQYRDIDDLIDNTINALINDEKLPIGATTEDLIEAVQSGKIGRSAYDSVLNDVLTRYDPELEQVFNRMLSDTVNPTHRTIGVRVGQKTVPFKAFGQAYSWFGSKIDNVFPNIHNIMNDNIFERMFPGMFSLRTARARVLGFAGYDEFRSRLQELARGFSTDEAKDIYKALENGTRFGDARLDDAVDQLRAHLDRTFTDEMGVGARGAKDIRDPNYVPIYLRGGSKKAREEFLALRRAALKNQSIAGAGEFTVDEAIRRGLKPSTNAFENINMRFAESRRNITQALFRDDLVRSYGIHQIGLPEQTMRARGLEALGVNQLSHEFRQIIERQGGKFYIPKDIKGMMNTFEDLSTWSAAEWGRLGRTFANIIGKLKKMMTLPNTGFHVKNMIGDVFMGLLDDVNPNMYEEVARKWMLNLSEGRSPIFRIIPGELEISFNDMRRIYRENADAGFFHVDSGAYESLTAGRIPKRIGHRAMDMVTSASDTREMIGRFTHFVQAYKDEAKALWNRGERNMDFIQRRASDSALWRVNGYKFDYGALMPWEMKLKTAAFPFYTYLRKAMPALLENMFINPHYFSTINRFMEHNDGSAADAFNEMNIPQYIRDLGFGTITDEEEPWAVTADILPLGALDILGSNSVSELSSNVLQNLNPLALAPIELATGHELFRDKPIDTNFANYLMSNIPMVGDINDEIIKPLRGESDKSIWEHILNERLTGLGLPIRQITSGQQQQQQNQNRDELIDEPIQEFNRSSDRYHITITDRFTYRVKPYGSSNVIREFSTPEAAIEFASQLPGATHREPYVSPYHQPTMADVQTVMGG